MAGDIASPIGTLLLRLRPAGHSAGRQTAASSSGSIIDHRLVELAHTVAQSGLDRVKPNVEKINLRRRFRLQAGEFVLVWSPPADELRHFARTFVTASSFHP